MATVALNLYNRPLSVEADPKLYTAPVAIRIGADSWLALTTAEADSLAQQLAKAVAELREVQIGNAGIDPGTYAGTPATADGHAAPIGGYPPGTWPTCQPVAAGLDSLGHGFDRRAQPELGKAA